MKLKSLWDRKLCFKFLFFLLLICIITFLNNQSAYAISINIFDVPSTITDEPFEFKISVNAPSGTSYFRADLYFPNTYNYFGYTFNGTDFYNESTYSQYLPITISSDGSASAIIKAKIDPASSDFKGPGTYNLKVRRYTSQNSYNWSNEATLTINYTIPTDTPSPTETPNATDTPIPSQTPTLNPTQKPITSPTLKPSIKPTKNPAKETQISPTEQAKLDLPASVLGTSEAKVNPSPTPFQTQVAGFSFTNILIIGGGLILILFGILLSTFIVKGKIRRI